VSERCPHCGKRIGTIEAVTLSPSDPRAESAELGRVAVRRRSSSSQSLKAVTEALRRHNDEREEEP
jgi:rRNA maturation protein Nop10